jgi:hypothetical protein
LPPAFALLRRGKEACWIGIGALAAPASARAATRPAARRPPRALPAGQA